MGGQPWSKEQGIFALHQLKHPPESLTGNGSGHGFRQRFGHQFGHRAGYNRQAAFGRGHSDQTSTHFQSRLAGHGRCSCFAKRASQNQQMAVIPLVRVSGTGTKIGLKRFYFDQFQRKIRPLKKRRRNANISQIELPHIIFSWRKNMGNFGCSHGHGKISPDCRPDKLESIG